MMHLVCLCLVLEQEEMGPSEAIAAFQERNVIETSKVHY